MMIQQIKYTHWAYLKEALTNFGITVNIQK